MYIYNFVLLVRHYLENNNNEIQNRFVEMKTLPETQSLLAKIKIIVAS